MPLKAVTMKVFSRKRVRLENPAITLGEEVQEQPEAVEGLSQPKRHKGGKSQQQAEPQPQQQRPRRQREAALTAKASRGSGRPPSKRLHQRGVHKEDRRVVAPPHAGEPTAAATQGAAAGSARSVAKAGRQAPDAAGSQGAHAATPAAADAAGKQAAGSWIRHRDVTYYVCKHLQPGDYWWSSEKESCTGRKLREESVLRALKLEGHPEVTSCHQCQEAQLKKSCTQPGCSKPLCTRSADENMQVHVKCPAGSSRCADENMKAYLEYPAACPPELLARFREGACSCCLGLCRRKACMKKPASSVHLVNHGGRPAFDPQQELEFHRHRLAALSQKLEELLQLQQQELARGSRSRQVPLLREYVPLDGPGGQERVLCDECGASLPELHRRCDAKSCLIGGSDICLQCLQTHPRWVGQDEEDLRCRHEGCTGRLQLVRHLDDETCGALERLSQEIAKLGLQGGAQPWVWLDTPDNKQALRNAPVYCPPSQPFVREARLLGSSRAAARPAVRTRVATSGGSATAPPAAPQASAMAQGVTSGGPAPDGPTPAAPAGAPQLPAEGQAASSCSAAAGRSLVPAAPQTSVEAKDAATSGCAVAGSSAAPAPLQAPAERCVAPAQPLPASAQPQWQVPDLSMPLLDLGPQQTAASMGMRLTAAVATQLRSLGRAGRGAGPEGLLQEAISKHAACLAAEQRARVALAVFVQQQVALNSVLARLQQQLEAEVPLSSHACGAAAPAAWTGNGQPAAAGGTQPEAAAGLEARPESPAAEPGAGPASAAAVVLEPHPGVAQPQAEVKAVFVGPSAPVQPQHKPAAAAAVGGGSQGVQAEPQNAAGAGPRAAAAVEVDPEATQPQTRAHVKARAGPEAGAAQAPRAPSVSSNPVPIPLRAGQQVPAVADLPASLKRQAAHRADSHSNYLLTLESSHLAMDSDQRGAAVQLFQAEFCGKGQPVLVTGIQSSWFRDQATLARMSKTWDKPAGGEKGRWRPLNVLCMSAHPSKATETVDMPPEKFFADFERGGAEDSTQPGGRMMLKLKDFPPDGAYADAMGRDAQAFAVDMPLPEYTHPHGPLNLASAIAGKVRKVGRTHQTVYSVPDLGPKAYIATGSPDNPASVTALHKDLCDAVNILYRVGGQESPEHSRCDGAGAVWDIFRREDSDRLAQWLTENAKDFMHAGRSVDTYVNAVEWVNPLHAHRFMLEAEHLKRLKEDTGIEPNHFEQHEGEVVFIPAGCPHQVRNLRPCVKVAFDFLAPTSVHEAAKFAAEVRDICRVQPKVVLLEGPASKAAIKAATAAHGPEQTVPGTKGVVYVPPSEREGADKLQYELSLYLAVAESMRALEASSNGGAAGATAGAAAASIPVSSSSRQAQPAAADSGHVNSGGSPDAAAPQVAAASGDSKLGRAAAFARKPRRGGLAATTARVPAKKRAVTVPPAISAHGACRNFAPCALNGDSRPAKLSCLGRGAAMPTSIDTAAC